MISWATEFPRILEHKHKLLIDMSLEMFLCSGGAVFNLSYLSRALSVAYAEAGLALYDKNKLFYVLSEFVGGILPKEVYEKCFYFLRMLKRSEVALK